MQGRLGRPALFAVGCFRDLCRFRVAFREKQTVEAPGHWHSSADQGLSFRRCHGACLPGCRGS